MKLEIVEPHQCPVADQYKPRTIQGRDPHQHDTHSKPATEASIYGGASCVGFGAGVITGIHKVR
jgi:hypothetical protein